LFSARRCLERAMPGSGAGTQPRLKAIEMWWLDIVVPALLVLAVYGFVLAARLQTRRLTGRTTRTAEDLYPLYADSIRQQRKYAREHGGQWRDDEQEDIPAKRLAPPPKTKHAER
jgi:hypothetical protein